MTVSLSEPIVRAFSSAFPEHAKAMAEGISSYPTQIVDLLIYHRLYFHMDPATAIDAFKRLRSEFVDWNEVRVSPIREIQEQVSRGRDSLELSVFIKDLLEHVHADRHQVDLEFLAEENLTDVRKYLRQVRNIEPASIELVLLERKSHPVVPLTDRQAALVTQLGIASADDTHDRKMKALFDLVGMEGALALHHVLLESIRQAGESEEADAEPAARFIETLTGKALKRPKKKKQASTKAGSTRTKTPARSKSKTDTKTPTTRKKKKSAAS